MKSRGLLEKYDVSPSEETARWDEHRLQQLLAWAASSFEQKVQSLEDMEETVSALGNQLDPVTGRYKRRLQDQN